MAAHLGEHYAEAHVLESCLPGPVDQAVLGPFPHLRTSLHFRHCTPLGRHHALADKSQVPQVQACCQQISRLENQSVGCTNTWHKVLAVRMRVLSWVQGSAKMTVTNVLATHLVLCSHLWPIPPLLFHDIEDSVHHIAWKGWEIAWAICKGTGGT